MHMDKLNTGDVPPWTRVSSFHVQTAIDLHIAETMGSKESLHKMAYDCLPTIRESLINVFQDDKELRDEAEEALEDEAPEAILGPFLRDEPKWVVRCSTTDGMMGGMWGLKWFVLGSRGYFYYHPDFGIGDESESLPIVGFWEPVSDRAAGLRSLKDAYIAHWRDFALPPSMGQWAQGPNDFLTDVVGTILRNHPSRWSDVLDRLRRDAKENGEIDGFVALLAAQVSNQTKLASKAVLGALTNFLSGPKPPTPKRSFNELEARVLAAAFVTRLGMGGF